MNRHTKVAFFVAPFLLVGGYVASDFYLESQQQSKLYNLTLENQCDVMAKECVLSAGEMKINVYDENGTTFVNSTAPLDNATLFVVNTDTDYKAYPLGMVDNRFYWQAKTPLNQSIASQGSRQTLRIIANIKGNTYISEFETVTQ